MIILKVFLLTVSLMTIAGIGYSLSIAYQKISRLIMNNSQMTPSKVKV